MDHLDHCKPQDSGDITEDREESVLEPEDGEYCEMSPLDMTSCTHMLMAAVATCTKLSQSKILRSLEDIPKSHQYKRQTGVPVASGQWSEGSL